MPQERFEIELRNMMSPKTQSELEDARRKIRIGRRLAIGCSKNCAEIAERHTEDCPNRNRYDVI